ncbi:MAG: DUF296 domain-containing protein [Polyangiales bacterium]
MTVFSAESAASRVVVGRIYRGQDLREALRELVERHRLTSAWLSAIGAFEWVTLTEYNQRERVYDEAHRIERCEVLSLEGNLSERDGDPFWHLHATVSHRQGQPDHAYGGHVNDASVFALEFRITCLDDISLRRSQDEATGLSLWSVSDGESEAAGAPTREAGVSWEMAARASAKAPPVPETTYAPTRGDWLEHPKFGVCKIEGMSGDGVCILKLPDARRKKIKITALQILTPRQDGDRTIYPVRPRLRSE